MTRRLCRSKCLGTHHATEASSGNCRVRWTAKKHLIPHPVSNALIIDHIYFPERKTCLFSGVPLDKYCRVDDASPECTVTGFSQCWVDTTVKWLYVRVDPLSQVERGRPQGLLQWLGGRSDASITRWWSCWKSARATCPKKRSRLSWIRWETGQQPVVCLTVAKNRRRRKEKKTWLTK